MPTSQQFCLMIFDETLNAPQFGATKAAALL
jgi:hypothetical protein